MITTLVLISALTLASNAVPPERVEFTKEQMVKRGITRAHAEQFFGDARLEVYPPTKGEIDWLEFRRNMVSAESIKRGLDFRFRHFDILKEAESTFDVRDTVIVSIFRIETDLGEYLGKEDRNAFSYLYSRLKTNALNKHNRPRWVSTANELAALAYYCFITRTDCFTIRSSHAGAIGLPQFMPSNILSRGHNGRQQDPAVDLFKPEHAIPSAANFLKYELRWDERKPWAEKKKILAAYYGKDGHYPEIAIEYIRALESRITADVESAATARAVVRRGKSPRPPRTRKRE